MHAGDEYPYRAEIRIELLNPPATCWGYDRPRRWVLPTHFGVAPEPLGQPTPAPFLCWPPLPAVPPTAPTTAEVFFTTPRAPPAEEQPDTTKQQGTAPPQSGPPSLGIQIRWIGDAAHCIESKSLLNVEIIPVAIRWRRSTAGRACKEGLPEVQLPSRLPAPVGAHPQWTSESAQLHQRLQAAQWYLVDRAVHLIYQAQAARLKNILDVVAYGTVEGARTASSILQEFEGLTSEVTVPLTPAVPEGGHAAPTSGTQQEHTFSRRVMVERWETTATSVSIQDVPVFAPSSTGQGAPSVLFDVDVEVWVSYLPVQKRDQKPTAPEPEGAVAPPDRAYIAEFMRRLPVVEALAVCFLRHAFLDAWKSAVRDLPRECFDLHYLTLPSTREARGGKLFVTFLDWLHQYLATRMLQTCRGGLDK